MWLWLYLRSIRAFHVSLLIMRFITPFEQSLCMFVFCLESSLTLGGASSTLSMVWLLLSLFIIVSISFTRFMPSVMRLWWYRLSMGCVVLLKNLFSIGQYNMGMLETIHDHSMLIFLKVDEQSPLRVMKTWFQSNLKVKSQASPMKTRFHSKITTTGSSLFCSSFMPKIASTTQYSTITIRQRAKEDLLRKLPLVIAEESQKCISLTTSVMIIASRKRTMKKKTAPMSWMMGQPSPSIVPMAARKPRVEICPRGSIHPQMSPGYPVRFFSTVSHRKMQQQTRLINPPAGSIKYRKTISWGQWQAVLVMVA